MGKASAIRVSGLSSGYGLTTVLEDIQFDVPSGECCAVIGRNGMGKTTLMASLMGLTRHIRGEIHVGGQSVETWSTARRALEGMAYVPQTRDVFPSLTVEENLQVGLKNRPVSALEEAYSLFPRLRERRKNFGGQLSGGEQQMLSIARSLLGQPSVLLLDEPLEGLAPVICQELMAALSDLKMRQDMTVIIVEQHVTSALELASSVVVLERGRVVWRGSAEDWRSDHALTDRYLGVSDLH